MTAIDSPTVPSNPTPQAPPAPVNPSSSKPVEAEGVMSLFDAAQSRLDKVLGQTTAQRVQRVGFIAAAMAIVGGVIAYRRMQK